MFETLQIVIPSRSRTYVKTVFNLSENLWPNITVVVPHDQYGMYRSSVPMSVRVLEFPGVGIAAKREFIMHLRKEGKVIMFDDDLTFYQRSEDGTKFPRISPKDTEEMVSDIVELLDQYSMVGLTDKFMSQTKPRGLIECHRFNQILGFNRDLLPRPWPRFRVPHDEEHDVHLQLLTQGYKTAVLTEWSKSDKSGAPGGCSDWRNNDVLNVAHTQLMELWPTIVSIDIKNEKPKARYNWREAKKIGGI